MEMSGTDAHSIEPRKDWIMIVEIHMLQNFAPSNLNRDDTGSPKDCEFGGYRRGRISSQCQKRAVRLAFKEDKLLPAENLGERTRRLTKAVADRLEKQGRDKDQALKVAEAIVPGLGLKLDKGQTQYLVFLGHDEIDRITEICSDHWDALSAAQADTGASKKKAKEAFPKEVGDQLKGALDGRKAADLALFGRMIADDAGLNRDAACQVAHAISTNAVSIEFDFFTAVDDLKSKKEEDAGAGMLGTVEFNSSCYYRYANVDTTQLTENLGGDTELVNKALEAFLTAFIDAIPTGKQNSFAAHNPPSLIFTTVRDRGQWSLANAFVDPVRPKGETEDLVTRSIGALDDCWSGLIEMYGQKAIRHTFVSMMPQYRDANVLESSEHVTVEALISGTVAAASEQA